MSKAILEYKNFAFSYETDDGADGASIGPVNWSIDVGSFTLLTGATGCGKTTLLRCAVTPLAPTGERCGQVMCDSRDVMDVRQEGDAVKVGYVAQSPESQLVCTKVWHQLAFGLENQGVDRDAMRRRVAEVAHFFGMEPWIDKDVNDLSGGQQQLVNLASVLAMRPQVLLLDEPTAQLDPVAQKSFAHALFRLNRELGLTIVVATHMPRILLEYATGIVHMGQGGVKPLDIEALRAIPQNSVASLAIGAAGSACIQASDLHFRYKREDAFVLKGFDLRVDRGELHALVGGNGCGKSTLLRVIAGVLKPERGRVHNALQSRQALMPQNPKALFMCDTVDEELREWQAACKYSDEAIARVRERLGLSGLGRRHPYDLSGGQQQLLALAKLSLTEPDLLLLDEPTKGLDPEAKALLEAELARLQGQGVTLVCATHDLAFCSRRAISVTMLFDWQAACTQPADTFFHENLMYRVVDDGPLV